ncbi:SapC family protein [Antarcticirhabdus aurantiaca]|uniref:SapC family protein n=1 Tax=Antarcticirhabdus aurantiaca TaxID=2606717 RepID=A0ACD4NKN8_9HYPH|nr:SapC family protein [Antarcticirhabdus aurantiaca]WAJ27468.1 SapC family protein [Jeongeuplla avenae]
MSLAAQPLARFASARARAPEGYDFAAAAGWLPLNDTEFHLTAHHLPLSVRILAGAPRLGFLIARDYPAMPPVDEAGRWRAGYMPIALRTFPFALAAAAPGARPIDEIEVAPEGAHLLGAAGVPVCLDPAAGTLGPELNAIRNTLLMMRGGGQRLSRALDLLRIAGLLAPLRGLRDEAAADLTVDPERFAALDADHVAALAAESFLPLDLATALLFSRRHLQPDRLPLPGSAREAQHAGVATPAEAILVPPRAEAMDLVLASLEALDFALDASDLFDGEGADWPPLDGAEPSAQGAADKEAEAPRAVA